jgi:hypothetical protein
MAVTGGCLMEMTTRLGCPMIGTSSVADRLTAVGVYAVSWVEASGLRRERGQLLPSHAERLDVAVEGRHVPFQ